MRGVVVFCHGFLVSCPYRCTSYHALESGTIAILGGYNAAVMDRHEQLNEMRHCALYRHVQSTGDLIQAITKIGARDGYIGTNILFASDERRMGRVRVCCMGTYRGTQWCGHIHINELEIKDGEIGSKIPHLPPSRCDIQAYAGCFTLPSLEGRRQTTTSETQY